MATEVMLGEGVGESLRLGGLTSELDNGGVPPPKIRSRAAWYCASRSAYDFCKSVAAADTCEADDGTEGDGRFRIRSAGWNAAGGGETTVEEMLCDTTTSGMGAVLLLEASDTI